MNEAGWQQEFYMNFLKTMTWNFIFTEPTLNNQQMFETFFSRRSYGAMSCVRSLFLQ